MSSNSAKPNRTIGILVALFVAVFGVVVFMQYSEFGFFGSVNAQAQDQGSTDSSQGGDQTNLSTNIDGEQEQAIVDSDLPVLVLELESGTVRIQLRPDIAPNHVARIIELSEQGFYDGIVFHRVIEGFMAQTGDPTGTGTGGSDLPDLDAEFNDRAFERGTLGMARSQSPDSANSQFFIVYDDASFLNGQYTLFGKVIEGMDLVDGIRKGSQAANGQVDNPDHIVSMRVETSQ